MAALKMMSQLQGLQGGKGGRNAAKPSKGNTGAGLPEEFQDSQKLLNIFGCFGNVRRIVFTDKKPDGALIEMDDARSAMKARFVTKNQTIGGKPFKVAQLDPAKFK